MQRLLAWPLTGFLLVFFVVPIAWLLSLAVREAEVPRALPRTLAALAHWQAPQPVPVPAYAALAQDLLEARAASTLADAARRLNYEVNGVRSTLMRAGREVSGAPAGTKAVVKPRRAASLSRGSLRPTGRIAPDKATSPKNTAPRGNGLSSNAEAQAAAAARSPAGSVMR